MRKALTSIFLGLISLNFVVSTVSAHVLKTDGAIGAVMHIDPEDDPIARQPATFFFEIKDKTSKFSAQACVCSITISKSDSPLLSSPLFGTNQAVDLNTPSLSFTFPERAVYGVDIIGKPRTAGAFQTFHLHYDVRVERIAMASPLATTQQTNTLSIHFYHYLGLGFIIVLFIALIIIDRKRARRLKSPQSGTTFRSWMVGLALVLTVSHALPVWSHHGTQASHDYTCCIPQIVDATPLTTALVPKLLVAPVVAQPIAQPETVDQVQVNNRSPPHSLA